MKEKKTSYMGATTFSFIVLILGLAAAYALNTFWHGSLLALGLAVAFRQFKLKFRFDSLITLFVFTFLFLTLRFHYFRDITIPLPYLIGGLAGFLFLRETIFIRSEIKQLASTPSEPKTK